LFDCRQSTTGYEDLRFLEAFWKIRIFDRIKQVASSQHAVQILHHQFAV
jgi:hypothetical protein